MIDPQHDELIGFRALTEKLPPDSSGRRLNVNTVVRWAERGRRGVRFESVRIGRSRFTTWDAVRAFLNAGRPEAGSPTARAERVDRELEAMGI